MLETKQVYARVKSRGEKRAKTNVKNSTAAAKNVFAYDGREKTGQYARFRKMPFIKNIGRRYVKKPLPLGRNVKKSAPKDAYSRDA